MAEPSSLLGKLETEVEIKASAEKFHHMFAQRPHHISKATFRDVIYTKANGAKSALSSSGTTFMANGEAKVAKDRIEAVDLEKNLFKMCHRRRSLERVRELCVHEIQATPKHGGPGSIVHWHLEYEKISEEVAHPETLLQLVTEISKGIDEHLLTEE